MKTNTRRFWIQLFLLVSLLALASLACQAAYRMLPGAPVDTPVALQPANPVRPQGQPTENQASPASPNASSTQGEGQGQPTTESVASPSPDVTATPVPKDLQLKVFEDLWKKVKDIYLYPDFNGLDWDAVHVEYRQKIEAGLSNDEFYADMHEMINRLGDNHSVFLSPVEAKAQAEEYSGNYNFVGIGVLISLSSDQKKAVILLVFAGSPAEKAGLKPRDSIFTADGQSILDDQGHLRNIIRGPAGTQVTLEVQSPGQDKRSVTITRQAINSTLSLPHSVVQSPGGKRIGYIFLMTFNDSTIADSFASALQDLSANGPLDGLIIDDRENSGGAINVMEKVLSYFSKGVVGHFFNRKEENPVDLKKGQDIQGSQSMPLVILVGKGSYSAGEIFPGILQDLGRAYLIGETTNGVVELKYVFDFADGSEAEIAAESFRPLNHPDITWEKIGVTPDLTIASNWDEYSVDQDPAVVAALAHIDQAK